MRLPTRFRMEPCLTTRRFPSALPASCVLRSKTRRRSPGGGAALATLHDSALETLHRLRDRGVGLVILDECHHLMSHWGRVLAERRLPTGTVKSWRHFERRDPVPGRHPRSAGRRLGCAEGQRAGQPGRGDHLHFGPAAPRPLDPARPRRTREAGRQLGYRLPGPGICQGAGRLPPVHHAARGQVARRAIRVAGERAGRGLRAGVHRTGRPARRRPVRRVVVRGPGAAGSAPVRDPPLRRRVALLYTRHWNAHVSPGEAVYAHQGEGRQLLEQARRSGRTPKNAIRQKNVFL